MENEFTGRPPFADELVDSLYSELRTVARTERRRSGASATLQTTALIHEAYLKLQRSGMWQDQQHFMRAAAQAMRQVLVDAARARLTIKRGEGLASLSLEGVDAVDEREDESLVHLSDAIEKLRALDERLAQVVECRFFAGYDDEQTAQALCITSRTVRRDWVKAKAWLYSELNTD
jgi:RNA polymerase sigma factor (TIGR02999 family)